MTLLLSTLQGLESFLQDNHFFRLPTIKEGAKMRFDYPNHFIFKTQPLY